MKGHLYLSLVTVLLAGCKKQDPEASLPPATHTGTNKSGYLINGEAFIPRGWPSGGLLGPGPTYSIEGGFSYDSIYHLQLNGIRGGDRVTMSLFLRGQQTGRYILNQTTVPFPQGGTWAASHASYTVYDAAHYNGETYVTDARHTGQATLTYADLRAGISAGTFEFTAVSTLDPSKTVTITSGRFDRKQ